MVFLRECKDNDTTVFLEENNLVTALTGRLLEAYEGVTLLRSGSLAHGTTFAFRVTKANWFVSRTALHGGHTPLHCTLPPLPPPPRARRR